uniref:RILP-like protein 2 n=1 Tax=Latimeria chalumnae TaxID=7897 RepID=H3BCC0_LATCH
VTGATMEELDSGPEGAFQKNPFELTVEDVYDISYVIGRDFLKITGGSESVSNPVPDLQFKVVRVLEMFETMVNKYNLTLEELKMERDNLKAEVERLITESPSWLNLGPDKMVIDLKDPNRPRFTVQELRAVLQERNQLKAQLLVAQEELQCYKSGILPQNEQTAAIETESITPSIKGGNEEKTMIKRLFSFKQEKQT